MGAPAHGHRALRVLAVAALVPVLAVAAPAAAHDQLVGADPAPDSTATSPAAVVLTFSAPVLDLSAAVQVEGPQGTVETGAAAVDGDTVTAALPPDLPGGTYTVTWRVASADGHPISGDYAFTVTSPPSPTPTPTPTPTPSQAPTATPVPTAATPSAGPDAAPQAAASGGLPGWVGPVAVLVGLAAGAAVLLARRR